MLATAKNIFILNVSNKGAGSPAEHVALNETFHLLPFVYSPNTQKVELNDDEKNTFLSFN